MSQNGEDFTLENYGATKLPEGISSYSETTSGRENDIAINLPGTSSENYKTSIPGVSEGSPFEEIREEGPKGRLESGFSKPNTSLHAEFLQETGAWRDGSENFQLFTTPFEPNQELGVRDRLTLVWGSAKPWKEFFDVRSFSIPPMESWSTRIATNLQSYLYNYIICVAFFCLFLLLVHPLGVLSFVLETALIVALFLVYPGHTETGLLGVVSPTIKVLVASSTALIFLLFFGLGKVLLDLLFIAVLFVVPHMLLSSSSTS
ncbi:hypothetical protein GpartN1_g1206.t1 [Galdieria partita]|uniref:PRA1 family protein n=1 Tax=Galdieria partita TaxID=83374 RepID=A0A9C7UNE2_9RHOD|nr:hypothetical protein GpartN1_g1206.t1 [Galdieria partita]